MRPFLYTIRISVALFLLVMPQAVEAQETPTRNALLIAGLGGSEEHRKTFQGYLFDTQKALTETYGFDEVTVLAEMVLQELSFVDGISNAEEIQAQITRLGNAAGADGTLYIILFGHGGFDGEAARLNIPRRDLSQHDYASILDGIDAGRIVFINTASASAPYIEALSAPGRVIITATRTGSQKNETRFPRFLTEGLSSPHADFDKNGVLSVREWFRFAAEQTGQWYEDNGNLATENAMIEDVGDRAGIRYEELEGSAKGLLAASTLLLGDNAGLGGGIAGDWGARKRELETEIATLISQKAEMHEVDYYVQLELLFVELAKGNAEAEAEQEG